MIQAISQRRLLFFLQHEMNPWFFQLILEACERKRTEAGLKPLPPSKRKKAPDGRPN